MKSFLPSIFSKRSEFSFRSLRFSHLFISSYFFLFCALYLRGWVFCLCWKATTQTTLTLRTGIWRSLSRLHFYLTWSICWYLRCVRASITFAIFVCFDENKFFIDCTFMSFPFYVPIRLPFQCVWTAAGCFELLLMTLVCADYDCDNATAQFYLGVYVSIKCSHQSVYVHTMNRVDAFADIYLICSCICVSFSLDDIAFMMATVTYNNQAPMATFI